MSDSSKSNIEAAVAIGSLIIGFVGAILIEPVVMGAAVLGGAVATAMRLSDRNTDSRRTPNDAAGKTGKQAIAG